MGTLELTIGILGAIVLIVAWIWETYENIKKHKLSIHLHFAAMYIFGNVMLTVYAWMISNMIFFWLSIILLVAIAAELSYCTLNNRKRR